MHQVDDLGIKVGLPPGDRRRVEQLRDAPGELSVKHRTADLSVGDDDGHFIPDCLTPCRTRPPQNQAAKHRRAKSVDVARGQGGRHLPSHRDIDRQRHRNRSVTSSAGTAGIHSDIHAIQLDVKPHSGREIIHDSKIRPSVERSNDETVLLDRGQEAPYAVQVAESITDSTTTHPWPATATPPSEVIADTYVESSAEFVSVQANVPAVLLRM